ncbi:RlpA-like double-psi beta-barrel-protein domain-containing protein-containing protein [Hypoxylon rubiginosum]|jgi:expansin (peptidoglycan-binding protein)|uniref:RlpA-like double-psi beta-barrel-protein domain-containing protein-containing protein n=1 Tax=Hypoxylon rubiginosum TaxID=110542 RepID=A0ACB9YLP9_9PEZI|nr:RlpA-like double-psi beta-barrel-protein domain-containing protein-containing protein [Hypoxylon rubiginosum]
MLSLTQIVIGLSCTLGSVLAFQGDITYYTPGLGSCGETNTEADMIVALSPSQFEAQADLCGKTIAITVGHENATAKVVDKCPGCTAESIDVSPAVFKQIGSLDEGRLKVTWSVL